MHKRKHKMFVFLGLVSFPPSQNECSLLYPFSSKFHFYFFNNGMTNILRKEGSKAFHSDFYSNFKTLLIKFLDFRYCLLNARC